MVAALVSGSAIMDAVVGAAAHGAEAPNAGDAEEPVLLDPLIVRGQRPEDPERLQDVLIPDFVRTHATATHIGHYARWRDPVCPHTAGLQASATALIDRRVAEAARTVGAPTAPDCEVNVDIIFTADPQALLDHLADTQKWVLGYHFVNQTDGIKTVRYPVQAWYATATRGKYGGGPRRLDQAYGMEAPAVPGSRLSDGRSSEIAHVLVVADLRKLGDEELGPIANLIAMQVLAQTQPPESCGQLPSILDLLAPGCTVRARPRSLTETDVAFLRALYSINLTSVRSVATHQLGYRMGHLLLEAQ